MASKNEIQMEFSGYAGFVTYRTPTAIEKFELLEDVDINLADLAKKLKSFDKKKRSKEEEALETFEVFGVGLMKRIMGCSKKYVKAVKITEGEDTFKSWDELNEGGCSDILLQLGLKLVMPSGKSIKKN